MTAEFRLQGGPPERHVPAPEASASRPSIQQVVFEFLQALVQPHSFDLRTNTYAWFGAAWGFGAPVLLLTFHVFATSDEPRTFSHALADLARFHVLAVTCVIVPLFSVLFGALGTIRRNHERLISQTIGLLDHAVDERTRDLSETCLQAVLALSEALDAKDPYTNGHSFRVWRYAEHIARNLNVGNGDLEDLRIACLLHDVGKIKVPRSVLSKRGGLDEAEWAELRDHPVASERIVAPLRAFSRVGPIVRHHHERLDGSGYPDGLAGDGISLLVRILAVADAFDAMRSARPYRDALGSIVAVEELRRCSGLAFNPEVTIRPEPAHWFDPAVVRALVDDLPEIPEGAYESSLGDSTVRKVHLPQLPAVRANCWEVMGCGEERASQHSNACPVPHATGMDGTNEGTNGGRVCWSFTHTRCTQGDSMARTCVRCPFFARVRREQGLADFVLIPPGVRRRVG